MITASVEACVKHAEPYEVDLQFITAKKRRLWVRSTGSAIVEAGVVIRVVGSFQDIDDVKRHASTHAILDLTGVASIDGATTEHLVRLIRAIQLLGAKSIVTGIQPSIADTLVTLGAGFAGATTLSNLRHALQACMRERKPEVRTF